MTFGVELNMLISVVVADQGDSIFSVLHDIATEHIKHAIYTHYILQLLNSCQIPLEKSNLLNGPQIKKFTCETAQGIQ